MNNVELSAKVKGYLKGSAAKAEKFEDLVAVSVSLLSENPEDMYVAVREGKILVEPYPYNDNNCAVEASAETVDKLFSGEMSFDKALAEGYVKVSGGDVAKFKALEVLVPDKKAKEDKPKAAPTAKAAAKPTGKPAAKPASKTSKSKKK
ncbi:MAG: SCP2 sterol-binding domain-containing protein [Oscillospiraceae bacterium]|nr:SCP2 sterol-binding domain-containing protein [Oscillospiraceae bacterium]